MRTRRCLERIDEIAVRLVSLDLEGALPSTSTTEKRVKGFVCGFWSGSPTTFHGAGGGEPTAAHSISGCADQAGAANEAASNNDETSRMAIFMAEV